MAGKVKFQLYRHFVLDYCLQFFRQNHNGCELEPFGGSIHVHSLYCRQINQQNTNHMLCEQGTTCFQTDCRLACKLQAHTSVTKWQNQTYSYIMMRLSEMGCDLLGGRLQSCAHNPRLNCQRKKTLTRDAGPNQALETIINTESMMEQSNRLSLPTVRSDKTTNSQICECNNKLCIRAQGKS